MTDDISRADTLHAIRSGLAFFGLPVDQMTDEEIEAGAARLMTALQDTGLSVEQAGRGLLRLALADCGPQSATTSFR